MLKNLLSKTLKCILLYTVLLNLKLNAQSLYANYNHWITLNNGGLVEAITQDANYVMLAEILAM
jgi:hypothetical protein